MNYQLLIGKTVMIGDSEITVEKITKETVMYVTKYRVNDRDVFTEMDIKLAIALVMSEMEEEKETKEQSGILGFFKRFGLFKRTLVLDKETLPSTDAGIFYYRVFGLRRYAYSTVGIFMHMRIGYRVFEYEFCWKEKKEYLKGRLPDPILEYKKVF